MLEIKVTMQVRSITTTSPNSPITIQGMILTFKLIELTSRVFCLFLLLLDNFRINSRANNLTLTAKMIKILNLLTTQWFSHLQLG